MKRLSIWDILTGIMLLGVLCLACGVGAAMFSDTPISLFPAQPTITRIVFLPPTATETPRVPRVMPPTWTPGNPDQPAAPADTATLEPPPDDPERTMKPTSTIQPTNTLYLAPTLTPLPTATPLPSATSANARCYVISETPIDNQEYTTSQNFTKSWTIKNNSGKTWDDGSSDFRFQSASSREFHTGSGVYDLQSDVSHGGSITFQIPMRAPDSVGTYSESWILSSDGTELCRFFVKIVVK